MPGSRLCKNGEVGGGNTICRYIKSKLCGPVTFFGFGGLWGINHRLPTVGRQCQQGQAQGRQAVSAGAGPEQAGGASRGRPRAGRRCHQGQAQTRQAVPTGAEAGGAGSLECRVWGQQMRSTAWWDAWCFTLEHAKLPARQSTRGHAQTAVAVCRKPDHRAVPHAAPTEAPPPCPTPLAALSA